MMGNFAFNYAITNPAMSTYVFGKGYLGMTKVKVPEKYFKVK